MTREPPLIASIDPGLDITAIVLFDLLTWHPTHQLDVAARTYSETLVVETHPTEDIGDRLAKIHSIGTLLHERGVALAYVEQPSIAGAYARNRRSGVTKNPKAMGKFWMAFGALLAGFAAVQLRVVQVPAVRLSKVRRHQAVRVALERAGFSGFGAGPRGGLQPDVLDAAFLGLYALTEVGLRPSRWLKAPLCISGNLPIVGVPNPIEGAP